MAYQPELEKLERRYADEPAKNFAQLAEAYRRGGRVDEALDLLLMHLQERPTYVSALIVLGRCHLDKAQFAEAAEAFERVLAVDGENIIALKVLAEVAQQRGDVNAARGWLARLLEVDPMNEDAEAQMAALADAAPSAAPAADAPPGPSAPTYAPDEVVIERASTEVAPPAVDEAAYQPPDLELEIAPEADVPVPEDPEESSDAGRFDGPVWAESATGPPDAPADLEEPRLDPEPAEPEMPETLPASPASAWRPEPAESDVQDAVEETAELQPFDSELAWGTGERRSREISEEDLDEAERAHEDTLDEPVRELPGLEHVEVPAPEEAAEVTPTEGLLSEHLARAAEEARPLPGLETTEIDATGDEATDTGAGEAPASEEVWSEPGPPFADDEAVTPTAPEDAEADEQDERGSLAGLPVIMPDYDDGEAAADDASSSEVVTGARPSSGGEGDAGDAEPEPVVTETMAELYARQGLVAEAKDVYRRLLRARPGDPRLTQRLGELERRRSAEAPAADPRGRYEAARTGGVDARDFLRAVLEGRPTAVTTASPESEAPSPMDEAFGEEPLEPRGAPTRPASDQPSLASVFGEEPPASRPTPAPSAPPSRSAGAAGKESGFSFDAFFGEANAAADDQPDDASEAPGGRTTGPSAEDVDDTDESFKAWLKGLKS